LDVFSPVEKELEITQAVAQRAAVPSAVTVVQAKYRTVAPDNDYRYNGKELNG